MTHEPECRCAMNTDAHTDGHCDWCICDRLRAAYARGIADARRAVDGAYVMCSNGTVHQNRVWNAAIGKALEYLDALRGDRGE